MKNIYSLLLIGLLSFSSLINAQQNPNFTLHTNGVTCLCANAANLETGDVNGVTYTKRTKEQITPSNASTTCTSGITDMSGLFQNNQSFNGNISTWDTSSVLNMSSMFSYCTNFNSDINNWNVSSVTNMSAMFHFSNFNKPIGDWNVSNVTNMAAMFQASPFNKPIDNWNVSNVTNMTNMFHFASFNQPLNSWNMIGVVTMEGMFRGSPFNQPLSNWNVSNVVNMSNMFENTTFNKPIGNWNVSSVSSMKWMFDTNTAFNQPINSWNVSNVSNMERMFFNTQAFNQTLTSWNVSNVSNMGGMFKQSAFNQNLSSWQFSSDVILTISNMGFAELSQMNIQNYDALLSRFDTLGLLNNTLRSNNLLYSNQTARDNLTNNKGWTITGDTYSAPPAPPTLSNSYVAPRKIKIDFAPSTSSDVTEYKVYKSTDNTTFTLASTITANSYTETGLQNGTTYYYRISAVNNLNQESTTFLEVSATPTNIWYVATSGTSTGFGSANSPMNAIQTAIDASVDLDQVIVSPGTYYENLTIYQKVITVSTPNPNSSSSNTIIDGGANGFPVVLIEGNSANMNNTNAELKFSGFTIQNGLSPTYEIAGGLVVKGIGHPNLQIKLEHLIIANNIASNAPGGSYFYYTNKLLLNDIIYRNNNGVSTFGAFNANFEMDKCQFYNNTSTTTLFDFWHNSSTNSYSIIKNSLIKNNTGNGTFNVMDGLIFNSTIVTSGLNNSFRGKSAIINSIIGQNQFINSTQGLLNISNSLVQDGQNSVTVSFPTFLTYQNNLSGDIQFVNSSQENYRLSDYSRAIGHGVNSITLYNTNYILNSGNFNDLDNNIRPFPAGTNIDLGAYENNLGQFLHNSTIYVSNTTGSNTNSVGLQSAPFLTIQAAINYAIDGDTIRVLPGVYTELISVINKGVNIISDTPQMATIEMPSNGNLMTFSSNTGAKYSSVEGFKINQTGIQQSTAVRATDFHYVFMKKCKVTNFSQVFSTGVSSATATNCLFVDNAYIMINDQCSLGIDQVTPSLKNCTIINATGIHGACPTISIDIINSIIIKSNPNIVAYTTPPFFSKVITNDSFVVPQSNSTFAVAPLGAIDLYFNDAANGDYSLKNYSPAIGFSFFPLNEDFNGNSRPLPLGSQLDAGAFENSLGTPSNAPPRIDQVTNITIDEDAAQQTINLSGIADGDLLTTQTVTVSHTNSDAALFSDFTINHTASAATGTLVFTPAPNAFGTANITISVQDNGGTANGGIDTKTISFTITINSINDAPVANNDEITVEEGETTSILVSNNSSVLDNDIDVENDILNAVLISPPTNGSLILNTDGSFTYSHNGSETTTDSFTYKANDGTLDSNIATVTITITPINDAPIANDDEVVVEEGGTISMLSNNQTSVLNNDTDAENDILSAVLVSPPTNGTLILNTDGTFTYSHNGSETITDSFTYKANDGLLDSNITTVNITINPVNDNGPTDILVSNFSINENIPSSTIGEFSVIDLDLPNDTHTYELVSGTGDTNNSSFTINGTNLLNNVAFDYETNQTLSIRVKVTDANAVSYEKVFTINVVNVNDISITHTKTDSYCTGSAGNGTITIDSINQIIGTPTYSWTATNGGEIPPGQVNNQNLTNLPSGTYTVNITDSFFTYTESFTIALIPQYADLSICYVSSDDTQVTKNRIYLNNQGNYNAAFYEILKESSVSNVYTSIGTILPNQNSFLDDMSNNTAQEYRYKVRLLDNCGNTSSNSTLHKTILLQSSIAVNNAVNLNWTAYEGTTIPSYIIYRKINQGAFQQIATISSSSTTYNDQTANVSQNSYEYYVAVGVSNCNISGRNIDTLTEIKSNRAILGNLSSNDFNLTNQIMVYPNPTTNLLNIKLNDGNDFISGELFNYLGQKVMDITSIQISLEQLPSSSYIIKIITTQGQANKTFIKN